MRSTPRTAIIGGTGADALDSSARLELHMMQTEYGQVGIQEASGLYFLLRHGAEYVAPHNINARAQIAALRSLGVGRILDTAACGSLVDWLAPGRFALLTDFVDFTKGRVCTFNPSGSPAYTDMSRPYDPGLQDAILEAARDTGETVHPEAVYACTEGPRFETRAEIRAYRQLGCHLVGMTQVPEVVLAAEAGIPYAALAVVTNFAAGMQGAVTEEEVRTMMSLRGKAALSLLVRAAAALSAA
jgi:5'-methylthioadenosine phosphorylase